MLKPENHHANGRDQPKQRIDKIHPNRILHPLNALVTLSVLFDIHAAEQAKERDP